MECHYRKTFQWSKNHWNITCREICLSVDWVTIHTHMRCSVVFMRLWHDVARVFHGPWRWTGIKYSWDHNLDTALCSVTCSTCNIGTVRSIINSWTTIWIISYDKISTIDTTTIIICLIIIIIIIGVVRRVLGYTKVVEPPPDSFNAGPTAVPL